MLADRSIGISCGGSHRQTNGRLIACVCWLHGANQLTCATLKRATDDKERRRDLNCNNKVVLPLVTTSRKLRCAIGSLRLRSFAVSLGAAHPPLDRKQRLSWTNQQRYLSLRGEKINAHTNFEIGTNRGYQQPGWVVGQDEHLTWGYLACWLAVCLCVCLSIRLLQLSLAL